MATPLLPPAPAASTTLSVLTSLLPYLQKYKRQVVLAIVLLLLAAITTLALPPTIRYMIDAGINGSDGTISGSPFWILFMLAVALAVFSSSRYFFVTWLGERLVADLRRDVYNHVVTLDPPFYDRTGVGSILACMNSDATLIQTVVGSSLSIAVRSAIILSGSLAMLLITSPKLGGAVLLLLPLLLVPVIRFGRQVRRLSRQTQDDLASAARLADETLNAAQVIQAFNLEKHAGKLFTQSVQRSFTSAIARTRMRAALTAVVIVVLFTGIIFVLWLGAGDVATGRLSAGAISQFILYTILLTGSATSLSEVWGDLQRAAGATDRLLELLHEKPAVPTVSVQATSADLSSLASVSGGVEVRVENVSFHYPGRQARPALQNVSFTARPGETTVLVGPSGAGKSTLFQLLLKFYLPTGGRLLLNDMDLAGCQPEEVRAHTAFVPQETALFSNSVRENIRYGRMTASDEEVYQAAVTARVDEFVRHLPDGYDTQIGEDGSRLSFGQRQRLAIARAMLRNAPLILLDEATSALDAENETLVRKAVHRLAQGRTCLVIAHHLVTAREADHIVVMREGVVVAEGHHEELMKQDGIYTRLATLQLK